MGAASRGERERQASGAARRAFRAARRSFAARKLNRRVPFDMPEARAQGKVDEATFWHAGGAATRGRTVTQDAHEKISPVAKNARPVGNPSLLAYAGLRKGTGPPGGRVRARGGVVPSGASQTIQAGRRRGKATFLSCQLGAFSAEAEKARSIKAQPS